MYPTTLTPPAPKRRIRRRPIIVSTLLVLFLTSYLVVAISRPFAELNPNRRDSALTITTQASNLPWPDYGQGALGLASGEIIATNGDQTTVPIASAAKVITALVVLERHPLEGSASGPSVTLTADDVALYQHYVAVQGSVTPVYAAEKLTERQMLQAMLLPSANNIADSLATWSYGSVKSYLAAANKYLQQQGLTDTTVGGDASGFLPTSVSTTSDLVKIGALAFKNPALAEIVGQKTALIPNVGTVHNYNTLLGSDGIVGIKTGNNDQNGGVFIGASQQVIHGQPITLITALSGAPNLGTVLHDSRNLLVAAQSTVAETNIVQKNAVLGTYQQPDGQVLQAVASDNVDATVLRGSDVKADVHLKTITFNAKAGDTIGAIQVPATKFNTAQSVPVILKQTPIKPNLKYRLLHP